MPCWRCSKRHMTGRDPLLDGGLNLDVRGPGNLLIAGVLRFKTRGVCSGDC